MRLYAHNYHWRQISGCVFYEVTAMKYTGIKRFFSAMLAIVLTVGLMPLPAFAETDDASVPVKLTAKQDIARVANGYTGTYDGKPHGISVDVSQPKNGATVKYGTAEGTYDLNTSPTITNVEEGPLDVYYQIAADGFFTTTGKETVKILPANPTIPTGITAYVEENLGSVSLPDGWSWVDDTGDVGHLGTKTFLANYTSTDPNLKDMSGVAIPVTVVERNHNWGNASYEWTFDNSNVTAKHSCSVCDIEETKTVATSSEVTKQPTCSAMGETTYTAEFANTAFAKQTKTVADVPKDHNAHSWGDWTTTTAATCEGEGTKERVCTLDGAHKETETVAALRHDWEEISWTTEDDEYMHWKRACKREGCNAAVEWRVKKGEAHIHHPLFVEGKAPTCEAPGNIEHVLCTGCSHRFTGLDCEEELSDSAVRIAPLGHAMGEWTQTTAPTCSATGESKRTCSREDCNHEETRDDAINPYAHSWDDWMHTTEPTCTKAGEDTRVCTHESSHTEKRVGKPATGHVWIEPVYKWADDNASVTATRVCKFDDGCEVETAAATSEVTQKPTCASKGKTTYTATFSEEDFATQSKSIEDVDIDPEAHEWGGWVATKYPTCTQAGTEEHVCAHDSSHRESRKIAVDPKAHSWGAWKVVKAATETEKGVKQRVCKNDASHVEKQAIPKLDPVKPSPPVKISIAKAKVTLAKTAYAYNGKAKKPKVKSVVLNGKKLKAGADYAVKYSNNKKLGTATVTVTGKGDYNGSAKAKFAIKLAKVKLSTIAVIPAGTSATASWKKVAGAKSYQLQYRKAGGKWKTAKAKGVSRTVKGLKAGKLYRFRVRAVAGKQAGAWSDAACRYLGSVKGVKATVKTAGSVTTTWKADPKANAGYKVIVRYAKHGAVVAQASVAKGKVKATVKGLEKGERYWVEVRPVRASGGKTYTGILNGAWAKSKPSKPSSVKS